MVLQRGGGSELSLQAPKPETGRAPTPAPVAEANRYALLSSLQDCETPVRRFKRISELLSS
jgi:hypothetical protein